MDKTIVYYYISPSGNNPVKEFITSLEMNQRAKVGNSHIETALNRLRLWKSP